jgi:tetratricopeptide (TPR) repeat protein
MTSPEIVTGWGSCILSTVFDKRPIPDYLTRPPSTPFTVIAVAKSLLLLLLFLLFSLLYGAEPQAEIKQLMLQGDEQLEEGTWEKAMEHYLAAADLMDEHQVPDQYLECFYSIAFCLKNLGRLQEFIRFETRIQPHLNRHEDDYLPDVLLALSNTHRHNRNLRKALDLNREAIVLSPPENPDYWLTLAAAFNNQGIIYRWLGETEQAILHYQQALRYYQKGGNQLQRAQVWNNIGQLQRTQGKLALARESFEKALDSLAYYQIRPHTISAYLHDNLGTTLLETGNYSQAQSHLNMALEFIPEGHFLRGNIFRHLGQAYLQQGQLTQANALFRQALVFRENYYPHKHPYKALSHRDLGDLALEREQASQALDHYQKALGQLVRDWAATDLTALPPLRGILSQPELLHTLAAKARAWRMLGMQEGTNWPMKQR